MFATVLFPIDRSQEAAESVSKALQLVQEHNSRLVLLSVVDPANPAMATEATVAQLLATVQKGFQQAGVTCDVVERQGNPAFVICDVADELSADVIVVASRDTTVDDRAPTMASQLIRMAPCPVLVVP
ncbi:universal stress protein [Candidatus Synechococcus spongiarum]|uniref:Universal stress protein n=1 Tax=Candidatus Synechococcus spongiarum LMB bulk15N TaxID=1943583 RepID=A0A1T1D410_9SYNE|nr:universal stress protein [Candidatus Synechococcus spongiarum]OOV35540.1 universal stress protein [Candidatus Synechococcus spongiarum LMB bulk15N]